MTEYDLSNPAELAKACAEFIETDFGAFYIQQLSLQYNALHQAAESEEMSVERKALTVERAAGLKKAIDFLTTRSALSAAGYHEEPEETS